MKRIIFIIIVLQLVFCLFSKQVKKNDLINIAIDLIELENRRNILKEYNILYSYSDIKPLYYNSQQIGYIVELSPEGYLLMPGITELSPIKFVSYKGDFSNIKDHPFMKQVFERLFYTMNNLKYIISDSNQDYDNTDQINISQKDINESIWTGLENGDLINMDLDEAGDVAPMTTSTWNQGATTASGNAYNMYTPTVDGKHTYTGCSATAQAQVMYYWKYPNIGQGSHSYSWNAQTLSANFNHTYYWDRMVNGYNGTQTPEQEDAVARLMSDVGISINMNYGLSGSGAIPNRNNSLHTFFKYSSNVNTRNRSSYASWAAWFDMFKAQMDNGWPCILATWKSGGGGHAVVIDGYRTNPSNQVHVNMGWGGYRDGYYSMDDIYGYGNASMDYAVTDIYPPEGKTITLTSPNGGESWTLGASENISWDSMNVSGNVKITLWQNGSKLGTIVSGIASSTGTYSWTVGSHTGGTVTPGGNYTVKIKEIGASVADTSDSSFSITSVPTITLTAPNGGESLGLADSFDVTWDSTNVSGNVKLTLWQNGSKLGTIVSGISASSGSYTWTVGTHSGGIASSGGGYIVKIKEIGTAVGDTSNSTFSITSSPLTVISPNGGETLTIDGTTNIAWSAPSVGGNVKITLWQNGSKIGNIVSGIPASAGTYSWTIGSYIGGKATAGGGYTIKIKEIGTAIADTSNGVFMLQ